MKKIPKKFIIFTLCFITLLTFAHGGATVLAIDISPTEWTYLSSTDAKLTGERIKLENNYNVGYWGKDNTVEWDIEVAEDGRYKVILVYARESLGEGEGETVTAVVNAGDRTLTRELFPTGGWQVWQTSDVGEIELTVSDAKISIGNKDLVPSSFVNLRNIILIPVSDKPAEVKDITKLTALEAKLQGGDITLENFQNNSPNICYWSPGCSAHWNIQVGTAGIYRVVLNYARASTQSDLPVVIEAGEQTVAYDLTSTNNWEDYADVEIGEIRLSSDDTELVVTHGDNLKTDLMNLRYVALELIEAEVEIEPESPGIDVGAEIFILAFAGASLAYAGIGTIVKKKPNHI